MEIEYLQSLDKQITQLNERCDLVRKFMGWNVVLLLAYGMLVAVGTFNFNALIFWGLMILNLGLLLTIHLMVCKVSSLIKNGEQKLYNL